MSGEPDIICIRRCGEPVRVYDLPADGPARERFERWMPAAAPGALLEALVDRAWRDGEPVPVRYENRAGKSYVSDVRVLWRLMPADLMRVKAAAIAAIEAAGGRVELGATVATVERGELRITMR